MQYFSDYRDVPSPQSVTKQFQERCEQAADDNFEVSMRRDAAKRAERARRSRAERALHPKRLSPIQPEVITVPEPRDAPPRTPVKAKKSTPPDATQFEGKIVCGTPQARRSTPLASPEVRRAPYHKEKTPKFPLGFEWPAADGAARQLEAECSNVGTRPGGLFRYQMAKELKQHAVKYVPEVGEVLRELYQKHGFSWHSPSSPSIQTAQDISSETFTEQSASAFRDEGEMTHGMQDDERLSCSVSQRTCRSARTAKKDALARILGSSAENPDGKG